MTRTLLCFKFFLVLAISTVFVAACEDSGSGGGSIATPGALTAPPTPEGKVWGAALLGWPQQGDPGRLVKEPMHKSAYDLWNDIRISPLEFTPEEYVIGVIEASKPLLNPLHELDGAWGEPVLNGSRLSPRSFRGIAKTMWADLRLALLQGDRDRALGDLLLLANLPRVARAANPTDRGLIPTLGVAAMFNWGLMDLLRGGEAFAPTVQECVQLRAAASWVSDPTPFGIITEPNMGSWGAFESRELPLLRKNLEDLCGN